MDENQQVDLMDQTTEEYYRELDAWFRRFKFMNLARWKLVQNTAISVLVAVLALEAGADANVALAVIALINGISFADLATVWGNRQPPVDEPSKNDNDDGSKQ